MRRREFLKRGAEVSAALGFGAFARPGDAVEALPESPGLATKYTVVVLYGNGARKKDVVDNLELAPCQNALMRQGTVFTEDYGETTGQHGYAVSEILQGARAFDGQRPALPTWNEYVRKKTGAKATDFFMLQGLSYYGAWAFDVKHYSTHPNYGLRWGATSLTMNKMFREGDRKSSRDIVDLNVERGLGASAAERADLADFVDDVRARHAHLPPVTREPLIERPVHLADAQVLTLAPEIVRAFRPKITTLQICGLDEGHAELGRTNRGTGVELYRRHLRTTDELIGRLWREIQSDDALRDKTALILRPDCGRDGALDAYGQLGHTPGDYDAHAVWSMALGPDFKKGHVVTEPVSRRDIAPTVTYLMSEQRAAYASGSVRTQMFIEDRRLPSYVAPPMSG